MCERIFLVVAELVKKGLVGAKCSACRAARRRSYAEGPWDEKRGPRPAAASDISRASLAWRRPRRSQRPCGRGGRGLGYLRTCQTAAEAECKHVSTWSVLLPHGRQHDQGLGTRLRGNGRGAHLLKVHVYVPNLQSKRPPTHTSRTTSVHARASH